jgi:dipeptidyl aminopeptidase/acylaminoacyl peptidase
MTRTDYLATLLSLPGIYDPQLSRDGKWVAWTWFRAGPAADVFVAPTDGSEPPMGLTRTDEDTFLVSWAPNNRAVIVEQDKGGNERAQLFQIDLDQPQRMIPLTEPIPDYFIRGGDLHPNGRWLVYGANYDFSAGHEIDPTWIFRHDLETNKRLILARPQKGGYIRPRLNSTGTHVLYSRKDLHPAGRQIWMVDIEGQEDREILNFGSQVKTNAFWFPDGKRVLVLSETPTHRRLGVWDEEQAGVEWLLDDPNRYIESAYVPYGSDHIVVVESKQARLSCSLLDPRVSTEIRLETGAGNLRLLGPAAKNGWVGLHYSTRQPDDLVRFPLDDIVENKFSSLTRVWKRTALESEDLTQAEDFRWKSPDGLPIQGWLYRPEGRVIGTIVYVHGGPSSHSQDKINPQIQYYIKRGFNVLDPNYRGSTGFDLAFREAIKEDGWGGREQEDIRAGIEALITAGIAETGKVGITGTSYGGYSAWCAITRFSPEILAAAAPICGMTDLVVDYDTTRPDLRPLSEEMMGGDPTEVPEKYYKRSPINFIQGIIGRLLIVQGAQDPNVTPENVRAVREALDQAGVPYEVLVFEDEGHGIGRPKNQRVLYEGLAEFFSRAFE